MRALLLVLCLAAVGAETAVRPGAWTFTGTHSGGGTAVTFSGKATLPLAVPGGHVVRISCRLAYDPRLEVGAIIGDGSLKGRYLRLAGQWTFGRPRIDLASAELGFVMPPDATIAELQFGTPGTATVADLAIVDLGPAPELAIDPAELLTDPGWEDVPERAGIPPENPYSKHLNGWQGWLNANTEMRAVTPVPSRVHGGRQALIVSATNGGIRQNIDNRLKLGRCYDFSVWAKGRGVITLYNVNLDASPAYVVSPDEWRQFHWPVCADSPVRMNHTFGIMVRGRVFFDDFSLHEIPRAEVETLRAAAAAFRADRLPPRVVQELPEERSREPVVLDNDRVRVALSPMGGGRVVSFLDKATDTRWEDLDVLAFGFDTQPVPIAWDFPFRAEHTGDTVTFSHTFTGGESAPFLDGIAVRQTFTLTPGRAVVEARLQLRNTAASLRPPQPIVRNGWGGKAPLRFSAYGSTMGADYILQTTVGQAGLFTTDDKPVRLPQPIMGWAAASGANASLVVGFNPRAVVDLKLTPARREVRWDYPRLPLPPGGVWETTAFVVAVPLDQVAYADRTVAAKVALAPVDNQLRLDFAAAPLNGTTDVVATVADYGGTPVVSIGPEAGHLLFTPPSGAFVTRLDIGRTRSVELFNDLPERLTGSGVHGAGELQYAPPVPARVIDLPPPGDLRQRLRKGTEVLWCYGLFANAYPFAGILGKRGLEVKTLGMGSGFPAELEELLDCRLVIVSDLGAKHLSANQRAALVQYVHGGGALLVTGGMDALGAAGTVGTDLEALLPATLTGAFDFRPLADHRLRPGARDNWFGRPKDELFRGLPWGDEPLLYWAHVVEPRPPAAVLARAGKETPVLLQWSVGHGRVMLFTPGVEGDPAAGDVAAWDWAGWAPFWARALDRLLAL